MRESRTYGSGRGARGNSRPYREIIENHARRLLRCISPQVALGVFHWGAQNFDAIGGTADIDWPPTSIASEAYDPSATWAAHFSAMHNPFSRPTIC